MTQSEATLPVDDLPALTPAQKELLASVPSLAYVFAADRAECDALVHSLEIIGIGHIRVFTSVSRVAEAWAEAAPAICLLKLTGDESLGDQLKPLRRVPLADRRHSVVAVVADDVMTLDGLQAFKAQVNCLIATRDLERLPLYLRRAWLHHLGLYRHWRGELEV